MAKNKFFRNEKIQHLIKQVKYLTTKMTIKDNEIILIYDSEDVQDREALGYAESLKHYEIKALDTRKHRFTELQIVEIADLLGINLSELINEQSETYLTEYAKVKLDRSGILRALRAHTEMMKTPIALLKGRGQIMGSSYEFIKQDMSASN